MASLPASKTGSGSGSGGSVSGANGDKRIQVNKTSNNNDHGLQPPRGLGLSDPPISPAVTTGTASSGNFTDTHMRQLIRPKKFRTLSNASSILSDIFHHPDANEDELKNKIKEANDRDREALYSMNETLRSTPPPPPPPAVSTQSGHQEDTNSEEKKHRSGGLWGLFKRKSFKAAKKRIKSAPPQIIVPEPPAAVGATTTTHTTEDGHRQTVISIPAQRTFNLGPVPRSPGFGLSPKSPITGTPIRPPRPSIGLETLIEDQETNERYSQIPASAPVIPPINDGVTISPLLPTEDFNRLQRVSGFIVQPAESPPELPQAQNAFIVADDRLDSSCSSKRASCQEHTLPEFLPPASPLHLSVCLSTAQSSRDRRSNMSFGYKLPDIDHTEESQEKLREHEGEVDGGETLAEVSEPSSSDTSHHRMDTSAATRDRSGSADVSSLSSVASSSGHKGQAFAGNTMLRRQESLRSNPSFNKGKRMALERSDSLGGASVMTNGNQSTAFHTPPDLPSGYATEPDAKALSSALEKVEAVQPPPLRFTSVMTVADLKPLSCKSSSNLRPSKSGQDGVPEQSSDAALTSGSSSAPLSVNPSIDSFQTSTSLTNSSTPQATPLSAPSHNLAPKPLQLRRTKGTIVCPPLRLPSSGNNRYRSRNGIVHRSGSHIDLLQQCEEFRHSKEKELDTLRDRLRQLENRNSWLLTAVTKQLPDGYYASSQSQSNNIVTASDDEYYGSYDDDGDIEERGRRRPHSRSNSVSSSPILSGFRMPIVSPRDLNSSNRNGNCDGDDAVTPRGRHFRTPSYEELRNNITGGTNSRASVSDRWSMTSQHTFGSTTADDSVIGTRSGTGTGFSSSNWTTGSRLTPPVQHTQHPRYNPSPVGTNHSGSGSGSGNSSIASLSAIRRPTPVPLQTSQAKPTLVTRSYKGGSTTAIPMLSSRNAGGGRGRSLASTWGANCDDASTTGGRTTQTPRQTQKHLAYPAARRERSLPRDPRLASFSSRSRSKETFTLHHRNRSHDDHIFGFADSGPSHSTTDNSESTYNVRNGSGTKTANGCGSGSGSRSTSKTRAPAPLPPSLTYQGIPDTAAQRREERGYRKRQEEIMRRLGDGSRGNTLHHSSSSASLSSLAGGRQQHSDKSTGATSFSASTSVRSTGLYNEHLSGSGWGSWSAYDSDQATGGDRNSGNTSCHDGRDPLTRLRDLRENVGRAISGIGIGLAVTTDDEEGYVYDGYGSRDGYQQYHRESGRPSGYGYGDDRYDDYGGYDGDGYGPGPEREVQEDRERVEGEYILSSSSNFPRHYHRNRDQHQRSDSPLPFAMPSWPSLSSLPSLPSLVGPSHSSLETEEWFPSIYRSETQQTQAENSNHDTPSNDQPTANISHATTDKPNGRTLRRKTTIAAMSGNKPCAQGTNRNEWETLEPLMRELISTGRNGENSGNGANKVEAGNSASRTNRASADNESGIDDEGRMKYNGEPTPLLVDKVFGFAPMDQKDPRDVKEEVLEDSVNLLQ